MKTVLLLLVGSFFILSGCTSPTADVGSMGLLVAAPVMTEADKSTIKLTPLGEGLADATYLKFQGSCSTHVNGFWLQVEQIDGSLYPSFLMVPTQTTYTVRVLNTPDTYITYTNDTNCDDGLFDFILSFEQVETLLGGVQSAKSVRILGETSLFGRTQPLSVEITTTATPPTQTKHLSIKRNLFTNKTGVETCDSFEVSLIDQSSQPIVATSNMAFEIALQIIGGGSSDIDFYETLGACQSHPAGSALSQGTITTGKSSMQIYYAVPNYVFDPELQLLASSSDPTVNVSTPYDLTVRNNDGGLTYYQAHALFPEKIYSNFCFPITTQIRNYDSVHSIYTGASYAVSIQAYTSGNTVDPNFKVYSNSNCATRVTMPVNITGALDLYAKYTGPGSNTLDLFLKVESASTSLDPYKSPLSIQLNSAYPSIDFKISKAPEKASLTDCIPLMIDLTDGSEFAITSGMPETFSISAAPSGYFYFDEICSTQVIGAVTVPVGVTRTQLYYQTTRASAGTDTVTLGPTVQSIYYPGY